MGLNDSLLPLGEGLGMRARSVRTKSFLVIIVFSEANLRSNYDPRSGAHPNPSQRERELRITIDP